MVEQALGGHDQQYRYRLTHVKRHTEAQAGGRPARDINTEDTGEDHVPKELEHANIHRGDNKDKRDNIEPGRGPAPTTPSKDGRPMVEAAGGWVCRCYLTHRTGDDHSKETADQPADRGGKRTTGRQSIWERGDAPREDAN